MVVDWERYLDHATTAAPKAPGVADRMAEVVRGICASPGRSGHAPARHAAATVASARARVATYFGCTDPDRVIFTSGATAALNLAIKGLLRPGDHVVASVFDHNSTLRPLARLRASGIRVSVVECAVPDAGFVDAVAREIRPATRLVIVNHASNVLGCILPYEAITTEAHARGVAVLLDTAQSAGVVAIDLSRTPVDLLVFSGHKGLLGPPGIGGLIVRGRELDLTPLVDGGTGLVSESLEPPVLWPVSFEAGTPNTPAIAALETAVAFRERARTDEPSTIRLRCVDQLRTLPGVTVYDVPGGPHVPVVSFRVAGMAPARVAADLDTRFGIQVRAGLHCAPLLHRAIGTDTGGGTVRASFGYGSTDRSVELLVEAVAALRAGSG